jgi:predicted TIM-barrel fold metal-dependent hydrolase
VEAAVPIIDMHAHVFPDRIAIAAVPTVSQSAGIDPTYDGTLEGLRTLMRRTGVSRSVVLPVATRTSQVRSINDWVAGLDDDDIVPFGAIHPDLVDPEKELERLAAMGFFGVKMHPEYQAFRPDDDRLEPLFAAAARLNLILYFHAGEDLSIPTVHSTPRSFARLLDRHPTLTVVLAHMGGWRQWDDVRRHLVGRDVYFDTSFTIPYLGQGPFEDLIAAHGVDRILYGSDVPWADAAAEIALLRGLPLPDGDLEAILGGNAQRLLETSAARRLAVQ